MTHGEHKRDDMQDPWMISKVPLEGLQSDQISDSQRTIHKEIDEVCERIMHLTITYNLEWW